MSEHFNNYHNDYEALREAAKARALEIRRKIQALDHGHLDDMDEAVLAIRSGLHATLARLVSQYQLSDDE